MNTESAALKKGMISERRKRQAAQVQANFWEAFSRFASSGDMLEAIDSSTKASWNCNECYILELFPDASYQVHWCRQVENLYQSPGIMIAIPPLSDEEWDDDPSLRYYDAAIEELMESVAEVIQEQEVCRG